MPGVRVPSRSRANICRSRALVGYGLFSEEKARVETAERGYHGACDGIPTLDESS
jgi:hypothetical protein